MSHLAIIAMSLMLLAASDYYATYKKDPNYPRLLDDIVETIGSVGLICLAWGLASWALS